MSIPNPDLPHANTILLFGPQALSFQAESFHQLRSTVLDDSDSRWVLEAVAELPSYLKSFSQRFPDLQTTPQVRLLEDLNDWFKSGRLPPESFHLPNVLLSPLVILTQLTQYSKYLYLTHNTSERKEDVYTSHNERTEVIGFCTGLLSALAISNASNRQQFQQYGAVAVRLAALIGAFVDAQDMLDEHKDSKSLATAWNSLEAKAELTRILKQFPEVR